MLKPLPPDCSVERIRQLAQTEGSEVRNNRKSPTRQRLNGKSPLLSMRDRCTGPYQRVSISAGGHRPAVEDMEVINAVTKVLYPCGSQEISAPQPAGWNGPSVTPLR